MNKWATIFKIKNIVDMNKWATIFKIKNIVDMNKWATIFKIKNIVRVDRNIFFAYMQFGYLMQFPRN
jgi:hypothetical protein